MTDWEPSTSGKGLPAESSTLPNAAGWPVFCSVDSSTLFSGKLSPRPETAVVGGTSAVLRVVCEASWLSLEDVFQKLNMIERAV